MMNDEQTAFNFGILAFFAEITEIKIFFSTTGNGPHYSLLIYIQLREKKKPHWFAESLFSVVVLVVFESVCKYE